MRGAIPPLSHVFMAWYLAKHRENFTFTFFEYFILDALTFPFFVSSVSMGLRLYFLLYLSINCATSLIFLPSHFRIVSTFTFSLIPPEPVSDSASTDSSFLQLLLCICIRISQESLLLTFFSVLPGLLIISVIAVAAACICYISFIFFQQPFNYTSYFFLKV
jgi:hypothetical protein